MVDYVCAAKHLCSVPTMPLPRMMNQPDGKPQHTCDGCGLDMHSAAFCGYLTDDVKDKLDKTTLPSGFGTKVGGTVCKLCYKKHAVDASTATTANDADGDPDDLPPLLSRDGGGLDGAGDASTATTDNDADGDPDDLPPLLSRDGGGLDGAGDASTATTDNDADRDPDDLPPLLSRDRGGLEGAGGKRPKGINDTGSTRKKRP